MQATAEGCVWGVAPCPSTLPATPRLIAACPNTTPTGHSPLPSTPHLHFPQHQFCQLRPIMLRPTIFSNSCPPCPTRPPLTSTSSNAISASLALLAGSQVNEIATSPRMSPTGTKSKGKCGGSDQHCPRHPRFQTKLPRRRTSRIARKGPTPYLCLTAPHSHRFESKGEKG